MPVGTEFLFDPRVVQALLEDLPLVRAALQEKHIRPSVSLRNVQKCALQIYRILGNTHYPHVAALVETLEFCLRRGFAQPTLLKTRVRKPFGDALAELHAAEHFLLNGFSIAAPPVRNAGPKPEFIASGHGVQIAVEVYSPRIWEGLSDLRDGLNDMLINWDAPFAFKARVNVEGRYFERADRSLPSPGELSDALTEPACAAITEEFNVAIAGKVGKSPVAFSINMERRNLNLAISLAVSSIAAANEGIPERLCVIRGPTLTGHAPEGIFRRLVARNVMNKARRRQAVGGAPLALLLVDLSQTDLRAELAHSFYRESFAETIRNAFGRGLQGYDAICFYEALGWKQILRSHFMVRDESRIPDHVLRTFFEPN